MTTTEAARIDHSGSTTLRVGEVAQIAKVRTITGSEVTYIGSPAYISGALTAVVIGFATLLSIDIFIPHS